MVLRAPSGMIHYRLADLNLTYCGRSVPSSWQRVAWDDLPQSAIHCERCWPHRGELSGEPVDLLAALEASLSEIPHRPWSAPRAAESTGEMSTTTLVADAAPRVPAGAGPRCWRWRTTLGQPHQLAGRVGQPVRIICRGSNGNELMEFPDGYRTVAPWRAALRGSR